MADQERKDQDFYYDRPPIWDPSTGPQMPQTPPYEPNKAFSPPNGGFTDYTQQSGSNQPGTRSEAYYTGPVPQRGGFQQTEMPGNTFVNPVQAQAPPSPVRPERNIGVLGLDDDFPVFKSRLTTYYSGVNCDSHETQDIIDLNLQLQEHMTNEVCREAKRQGKIVEYFHYERQLLEFIVNEILVRAIKLKKKTPAKTVDENYQLALKLAPNKNFKKRTREAYGTIKFFRERDILHHKGEPIAWNYHFMSGEIGNTRRMSELLDESSTRRAKSGIDIFTGYGAIDALAIPAFTITYTLLLSYFLVGLIWNNGLTAADIFVDPSATTCIVFVLISAVLIAAHFWMQMNVGALWVFTLFSMGCFMYFQNMLWTTIFMTGFYFLLFHNRNWQVAYPSLSSFVLPLTFVYYLHRLLFTQPGSVAEAMNMPAWNAWDYILKLALPLAVFITLMVFMLKCRKTRYNFIYHHAERYMDVYYFKVGIPLVLIGLGPYYVSIFTAVYNTVKNAVIAIGDHLHMDSFWEYLKHNWFYLLLLVWLLSKITAIYRWIINLFKSIYHNIRG